MLQPRPLTVSFIHSIIANFSSTSLRTMSRSYRDSIPRTVKNTTDFLLLHTYGRQDISEDDDTNNSRQQRKQSNSLPLSSSTVKVPDPRTRVVSGQEWNVLLSNMTNLVANNFTDGTRFVAEWTSLHIGRAADTSYWGKLQSNAVISLKLANSKLNKQHARHPQY